MSINKEALDAYESSARRVARYVGPKARHAVEVDAHHLLTLLAAYRYVAAEQERAALNAPRDKAAKTEDQSRIPSSQPTT